MVKLYPMCRCVAPFKSLSVMTAGVPPNTIFSACRGLILDQHRRQWPNIKSEDERGK